MKRDTNRSCKYTPSLAPMSLGIDQNSRYLVRSTLEAKYLELQEENTMSRNNLEHPMHASTLFHHSNSITSNHQVNMSIEFKLAMQQNIM